jgi:hypothetical protein
MASCYVCGVKISAGQAQRRWVPTESSGEVSFGNGPPSSLHPSHSVQTLCTYCTEQHDTHLYIAAITWLGVLGLLVVVFLSLFSP